jgi:hypothetical protein
VVNGDGGIVEELDPRNDPAGSVGFAHDPRASGPHSTDVSPDAAAVFGDKGGVSHFIKDAVNVVVNGGNKAGC